MTIQATRGRQQSLRALVLDTARDQLIREGVAGISMERLAARAGVAQPTLHRLFATKSDLIAALAAGDITLLERHILQAPGERPLAQLTTTFHRLLEAQVGRPRLVIGELGAADLKALRRTHPEWYGRFTRVMEALLALTDAAIARGEIAADLDRHAVVLAFTGLLSAPFPHPVGDCSGSTAASADTAAALVRMFERGVSAASAGQPAGPPAQGEGSPAEPLSRREREVLELLAAGHTDKTIARALTVAVSTVRMHVRNIYGKLGVNRRSQAIVQARRLAILPA
jgi:DNA-binding CsgD family transcriptional regulator/AcrR family transcriptional regulator